MLPNYPRSAGAWETCIQLALLMIVFALAGFYGLLLERPADSDFAERSLFVERALWINGVSFLLSVSATFLRRSMVDPPFALAWAAILAVAAGAKKPVVRGDSIVAATVMRVSLSADHRAIDGAVSARFLQSLKGFLENPASMLL